MATQGRHELVIKLSADGKELIGELRTASGTVRRFGAEAEQGGDQASRAFGRTRQGVESISSQLARARNELLAFFGIRMGGQLAQDAIRTADAYGQMESRLRLVTSGQGEFNLTLARLEEISRRSYRALAETSEVFLRSVGPMRELGHATGDVLAMTEAVSLSLVVSATNAERGTSVIDQFGRAMETGALRGEAFNTVIANAPRLAQALADGLGVTRAELRAMAEAGELTASRVLPALSGQLERLRAEAESMPVTVEDAMVRLRDSMAAFLSQVNNSTGFTVGIARAVEALARNLDVLMFGLLGIVGLLAGRGLAALVAWTQRKLAAAGATTSFAAATRLAAGGVSALGASMLAFVGGPLGALITGAGIAAAVILTLVGRERQRQQAFADGLTQLQTVAERVNTVAAAMADLANTEPPAFADAMRLHAQAVDTLNPKLEELAAKQERLDQLSRGLAFQRYRGETQRLREEIASLSTETGGLVEAKDRLWEELSRKLEPAMQKAAGSLMRLTTAASATDVWNALAGAVRGFREEIDRIEGADALFASATQSLRAMSEEAQAGLETTGKTKLQIAELRAEQRIAAAEARGDSEETISGLRAQNAAWLENVARLEAASNAVRDAARARREGAQAQREAQQAAEELRRTEEGLVDTAARLAAEVAGPAAIAAYEYERAVSAVREQLAGAEEAARQAGLGSSVLTDAYRAEQAALTSLATLHERRKAELARERDILGQLNRDHAQQVAMLGMSRRELAGYQAATRAVAQAQAVFGAELEKMPGFLDKVADSARKSGESLYDMEESARELEEILGRYDEIGYGDLVREIATVEAALEAATKKGEEGVERMEVALIRMNAQLKIQTLENYKALIGAAQAFTTEGSRGFEAMEAGMAALSIAQDIIALKAAVSAVLTQGQGDPYSAWGRMVAMAAAVAPFLASIGQTLASFGGGGGFQDTAAQRQASQGTGTVLGSPDSKSESIARATQITADATTALVGINRGMLRALVQLQDRLGSAGGMLARGAGDADFSGMPGPSGMLNARNGAAMGAIIGSIIPGIGTAIGAIAGAVLGSLLRGSSRVTDRGLRIGGGGLDDINVDAYQETQYRRWRFGSRNTLDQFADVSDQLERQFQLVIESIANTVREGALALGLLPDDIEAALASFRIEEIRISTMDLSPEEAQAELEAVFSAIFDDLAGHVVPWIGQFQQMGEGLGETLVRVATGVQVTQEAMRHLGFALDETDPERFAQISEALIGLVGGLDEMIQGMSSFMGAFASDAQRLQVAGDALERAFAEVGLTVPESAEAMWALMQTLEATTESGREQIATLIRLSEVAAEYYRLLEAERRAREEYAAFIDSFRPQGLQITLNEIARRERDAIAHANQLARAAGMQGAAERDLVAIHRWAAQQVAAAIAEIQGRIGDLVAELYGTPLSQIEDQIRRLEMSASSASNGLDGLGGAVTDLYARHRAGILGIQAFLDEMLLGDQTALGPEERLAAVWAQLQELVQAGLAGDADALAQIPQLGQLYLRLLRDMEASGSDYTEGWQALRDLLGPLADLVVPGEPGAGAGGGSYTVNASAELQALYEQRDALLAQQEAAHRLALATQLAQHLADLAGVINVPVLELATTMGVELSALAADLGVNLENITGASVQALASMAGLLGVSLAELTTALGLELTDLSGGVTELATQLGIDLSNLTVQSTQALAALAGQLGTDLTVLAQAVGVDLGSLADAQSLLNQALAATINQLPEAQRDELQGLFQAIVDATSEADANAAIAALEEATNALPAEQRNLLAPYLTNVFPAAALTDLDFLGSIDGQMGTQTGLLEDIKANTAAANAANGVPGFAVGTSYVPHDMLANIHQGEMVIDAQSAALMRYGIRVRAEGGGTDPALHAEVARLREDVRELINVSRLGHDRTAGAIDETGRRQEDALDRQTDALSRRTVAHA